MRQTGKIHCICKGKSYGELHSQGWASVTKDDACMAVKVTSISELTVLFFVSTLSLITIIWKTARKRSDKLFYCDLVGG